VIEDDSVVNPTFNFEYINWQNMISSCQSPMFLFVHRSTKQYGLWAQVVSREGARFMVDHMSDILRVNLPIDLFIWQHPEITRYNMFATTGAWLFQQVTPENSIAFSERLRINMMTNGHMRDHVGAISR